MTDLFILLALICPDPYFHNTTKFPWNDNDKDVLKQCVKRCSEVYPDSPCVKYFKKYGKQDYSIVCGPQISTEVEYVSFEKHIKPIFKQRCTQCHVGKQDWTKYENSFLNKDKLYHRIVKTRSMPPGAPLPKAEFELIKNWLENGTQK